MRVIDIVGLSIIAACLIAMIAALIWAATRL